MRILIMFITLLSVLFTSCSIAGGEVKADSQVPQENVVETRHTITMEGQSFSYLARTGFIPILDSEGKGVGSDVLRSL